MEFKPTAPKGAIKIRFIEGSLDRFDGKTLSVGRGKDEVLPRRKFVTLCRKVVTLAKQNKVETIELSFKDLRALAMTKDVAGVALWKGLSDFEIGEVAGCAFVMADYEHNTYKTKPKDGWSHVKVVGITNTPAVVKEGFLKGQQIADAVNLCRELSNTPGGDMTPKILADAAKKAAKGTKATVVALGREQMSELGMGAVLGMAKGSTQEPQFIVVEYWGAEKSQGLASTKSGGKSLAPVVLIGKGVTFDTGGLNIKTGDHMYEMHMDMSGGAAALCTAILAARLKLPVNVVALVPAVENSPSGDSVRPGDVLTSMSGRTIEVLNTDAEGRVILSDAITYAKRYNPAIVAEVSTLTGASLIALGQQASAFMTGTDEFVPDVMHLAEESGDYMWPLPSWEEYEPMVKGVFGDICNIPASGNSRYAGVIGGGMFLREFFKDLKCTWLHIDMAPRMTAAPGEHLAKGAAGAPVRFLLRLVESYANKR